MATSSDRRRAPRRRSTTRTCRAATRLACLALAVACDRSERTAAGTPADSTRPQSVGTGGPASADTARARSVHASEAAAARRAFGVYVSALRADSARRFMDVIETILVYDKQKLVTEDGTDYGPLAWVAPEPELRKLERKDFETATAPPGIRVALVAIDKAGPDPAGVPTYGRLHFGAPGVYCITITGADKAKDWKAYAVPFVDKKCASPGDYAAYQLDVDLTTPVPDPESKNYPPVARWELGTVSAAGPTVLQPTIGVRCGRAWCEIGPRQFKPGTKLAHKLGASGDRLTRVGGWHDEQRLSVPDGGGKLKPKYAAAIVPTEDFSKHYSVDDFEYDWMPVARILLADKPDAKTKYGKAKLGKSERMLSLKKILGTDEWYAHYELGGDSIRVERHDHHDMPSMLPLADVVRWDWRESDEDVWVACADGCCYVQLDGFARATTADSAGRPVAARGAPGAPRR